MKKLISICIPAYNRPNELLRLLESIDSNNDEKIEIVICEDNSPKRLEIGLIVNNFKRNTRFLINYFENPENVGYDANLRNLIDKSQGEYVLFMGDDDVFVPKGLDQMISFLEQNERIGYVLRAYQNRLPNGEIEVFRYFSKQIFFKPGLKSYISLFRKSVFISGFTIKKTYADGLSSSVFDGGLLYQLYLVAEVSMNYETAYSDIILTESDTYGIPYFGSSEKEKKLYTPGEISINNSVNFMYGFFDITNYMDEKYSFNSTDIIKREISKYSYPILSIQRNKGFIEFRKYVRLLKKIEINRTLHFYIYYYSLLILGKSLCDKIIRMIKKIIGRTPRL